MRHRIDGVRELIDASAVAIAPTVSGCVTIPIDEVILRVLHEAEHQFA